MSYINKCFVLQVVDIDDSVLEKPADHTEAVSMLTR